MRVYSVPSSAPLLRTTIAALVDGRLVDGFEARRQPERLAEATLYLPTRRAGRLAREIFLDVLGTDAVLLPRIVALGDIDEDELAFAQAASGSAELEVPPALEGLPRRLLLAQLIAAWAKQIKPEDRAQAPLVVGGPASTLALADDLARLMDDMVTRGVAWSALDALVPDALDTYWQLTLRFLNIAKEVWPPLLAADGKIEPAARRDLLIEAEAKRLTAHHAGPVIAAGSTGSMPATAKLLTIIAKLPQGAVVLPGLDLALDESAWQSIGGTPGAPGKFGEPPASNHAQFAMHALLTDYFGIARKDVALLGEAAAHGREMLASEAMRPSGATAQWHRRLAEPQVAASILAGMTELAVIAAPNSEMEALAIAVAMRQAREAGKSAALVTPDRALARRVMAALGRWQLQVDDSGGDALTETPAGIFARLAAEAALRELEPATLLAILKHPLLRLGRAPNGWRDAAATLELALLRGTRPQAGSAGLLKDFLGFRQQLARLKRGEPAALHPSEPRARLGDDSLDRAHALIVALQAALAPLESVDPTQPLDFSDFARRHRAVLIALTQDDSDTAQAFEGRGSALAIAFDDLDAAGPQSGLMVAPRDYADVFQTAFSDRMVRRPEIAGATLRIYGPLEARLTESDRVILGGLVEGVWPPAPRIDPWLSRPMRHQLGLDLPERRIGLSAHDFAQLLGAEEVILSHAAKVGGAPAVASRFLHRLEAVAGAQRWSEAQARGRIYLDYAEELDRPAEVTPIAQPMPRPPREARPTRLSVTAIEDWLRDPYTIYAKYILKLSPLDPVDMPLSAANRGSAIHEALGEFTQLYATALPDDPAQALRAIGEQHFAPLMAHPEARALWWPRFARIAEWFANWETERRLNVLRVIAETEGKIAIPLDGDRQFILTARADRIEHRRDRTFAILDYKTGQPPTGKQVRMGLSPQLTLEAAILRDGGFDGIAAGASVSELTYVKLSGNNPPGDERILELKRERGEDAQFPDDAADEARAKVEALIRKFDDPATPYTSLNLSMWANRYGRYDDLARIKEWSAAGGAGDES
ncbi:MULTISPECIES: double-strand break repair protein AddB [Rhodopseudomonas]|uniref:Recombinase RecB n=1 Tax=Rhodopseudomonas palustris TaxID=1076 RepID=A0A0D7EPD8_RHOPL|nr:MULTISPECIES: double-strand break repair protein AddB [Rhodopseudomonas]KIZ42531.1 recombinase RecB [Rhodopseudomonas palustris]MDF3810460.1 double-strand break repair protein AddB [Rhodopseudomonas sp. BAL398]WOK16206.1 double-strand break repair protein AddB [Rhodopseudomonas sp. BAL398]